MCITAPVFLMDTGVFYDVTNKKIPLVTSGIEYDKRKSYTIAYTSMLSGSSSSPCRVCRKAAPVAPSTTR